MQIFNELYFNSFLFIMLNILYNNTFSVPCVSIYIICLVSFNNDIVQIALYQLVIEPVL